MRYEETQEYSRFHLLPGNRPVSRSLVKVIKASIGESNELDVHPIIVNEKGEIVDGQHRWTAAKELHIPFWFIQKAGIGLREAQIYNSVGKLWRYQDYLDSYIKLEKEDYIHLQKYINSYPMGITIAMEVLTSTDPDESQKTLKRSERLYQFKTGSWRATARTRGELFGTELNQYRNYIEESVKYDREYVRAVQFMFIRRPVEHLDMMEKLREYAKPLKAERDTRSYIRKFEDIYGKGRANAKRFF